MGGEIGVSKVVDGSSAYNRPRRPNADTINYLRGLPLDVDAAKNEISLFLESGQQADDFPQSLAAAISAVDEVRLEIASLAGDELGSQCIETLAHICSPFSETASRVLLSACSGYHLHLATHRYGSHVVQSILQLAVSSMADDDIALHSEAPPFGSYVENLPSLQALIEEMVEELSPSAPQLAIHVCGSHVLRTLLCVLGGVDLLASGPQGDKKIDSGAVLRGRTKSKKKKKKPGADDSSGASSHAGTMRIVYRKNSRISMASFATQLEDLTRSLLGKPTDSPGELQQLACHPSAGPLLIVLLRVLTYSTDEAKTFVEAQSSDANAAIADFRLGISRPEPAFEKGSAAHTMANQLLCWREGQDDQKNVGDVIYGYSGEPRGSHVLETLLRLCPDDMHEGIIKYGDFENPTSLTEYSEHEVSNFVVQTLLTTIRNKEQATRILKSMEKVISDGLAINPSKRRRGLFWRSCEVAAKFRVGQESVLKAMRMGFGSTQEQGSSNDAAEASEGKKKKQRKKASAFDTKDCVPLLIGLKMPKEAGGKVMIDAAGARAVYQMLHFAPRLCEDILKGVLDGLSSEEIESLARDGLGSRCILDGMLEGPPNVPAFASAFKSLFSKLQGRWTSLATDRVGHHTVRKLFHALPKIDDKAKLVEELVDGGNRLNGNAMGRAVSEECQVEQYRENRKDWRKVMTSTANAKEKNPADEIISEVTKKTDAQSGEQAKSKRKRKRKRSEKSEGDGKKDGSGKKRFVTDAIIEALTVQTKS